MLVAPAPLDEHARLAALYALRLLDTPAEERFDSVTSLAAEIFRVPIAFVSFIDRERQWLKSKVGLEVCETSRQVSFCSFAILEDEALVIPDTRLDPRFVDNPLVTGEPFIRFYAGQPLRAPGGEKIGTLCLVDHVGHEFTASDRSMLKRLGSLLERELRMTDLVDAQKEVLATQLELLKTQERLHSELLAAARYIESLLPKPLTEPVSIDWRYLPSDEVGGDCLGYHRLEDGRIVFYVLDVCGHGVGAAMLSVTLLNILRSESMSGVDFSNPAAVLTTLNRQFQMNLHGRKFFTIWYGVLTPETGHLVYSSGGHPPAIIIDPDARPRRLDTKGIAVGCVPWATYENVETHLEPGDALYVFSDGAYDVRLREGGMLSLEDFEEMLIRSANQGEGALASIVKQLGKLAAESRFSDDVSLLELRQPPRHARAMQNGAIKLSGASADKRG